MKRSSSSNCASRAAACAVAGVLAAAVATDVRAQSPATTPPAGLLEAAVKAEAEFRFDQAAANLYQLLIEQPRAAETPAARLRLAKLLAMAGDFPSALLECQALRDSLAADQPLRQSAVDLATTLARRFRANTPAGAFAGATTAAPKGMPSLDEPTAIETHASGSYLVVDSGSGKTYRVTGDSATALSSTEQIQASVFLPDATVVTATKLGMAIGAAKTVAFTGSFGGKTNPLRKARALAALSNGDLLVVDKDFDGLLRCKAGSTTCAPFGAVGKIRSVKTGASDLVYVLDDKQQSVRVLDLNGKPIATIGPVFGTVKLGEIVDFAVDGAYGVYLLDKSTRRVYVATLRPYGGGFAATVAGTAAVPSEGERAVRNPSAIGVLADGSVLVAGRSSPRLLRLH